MIVFVVPILTPADRWMDLWTFDKDDQTPIGLVLINYFGWSNEEGLDEVKDEDVWRWRWYSTSHGDTREKEIGINATFERGTKTSARVPAVGSLNRVLR